MCPDTQTSQEANSIQDDVITTSVNVGLFTTNLHNKHHTQWPTCDTLTKTLKYNKATTHDMAGNGKQILDKASLTYTNKIKLLC